MSDAPSPYPWPGAGNCDPPFDPTIVIPGPPPNGLWMVWGMDGSYPVTAIVQVQSGRRHLARPDEVPYYWRGCGGSHVIEEVVDFHVVGYSAISAAAGDHLAALLIAERARARANLGLQT